MSVEPSGSARFAAQPRPIPGDLTRRVHSGPGT